LRRAYHIVYCGTTLITILDPIHRMFSIIIAKNNP
jgi:hypothetical protein